MDISKEIYEYWSESPPYLSKYEEGTKEWSDSILDHKYEVYPYYENWIDFEKYEGKRVLDIGCGSGSDLLRLARSGAKIVGLDITDRAVELSKKRLISENFNDFFITKYNGKSFDFFEDASFDLVISSGVLHHTPFIDDIISEVYRVLSPNGKFSLMVYNKHSLLYYYSILYLRRYLEKSSLSRDEILSFYSEFRNGCKYTRCYTENEIKDKLWFFNTVNTNINGLLYDTQYSRKVKPKGKFNIYTGIADIDLFFKEYNISLDKGDNMEKYGWHLFIKAIK